MFTKDMYVCMYVYNIYIYISLRHETFVSKTNNILKFYTIKNPCNIRIKNVY